MLLVNNLRTYWGYFAPTSVTNPVVHVYANPTSTNYQRYQIATPGGIGSNYIYDLTGIDRFADTSNIMAGSLQSITYAQGGNTTLTYESNDYLDVPLSTVVDKGGGMRIKQITETDNVTGITTTRNYNYLDPATGLSSGKPVTLPVFSFVTPNNAPITGMTLWGASTLRSSLDLSQEDHTIMYAHTKVSQTGAGSTEYLYYIPATNWDNTAAPVCTGCTTDWYPTTDFSARPSCANYGLPINDFDTYPFAPNPNYDFERGILQKVITYNEDSTPKKTSETDYTYQRTNTPGTITAFKWDANTSPFIMLSEMAYAKYNIYYGTSELTTTATKSVYDTQGLNQAQTSATTYTYGSTYHMLASQQVLNSDSSIVTTNYKYAKDFTISPGNSNPNINALYKLQQLNIDAPVETHTTIKRGSASPLVTGASLTLFGIYPAVGDTLYMPAQQLQLVQPNGGASFSPFSFSGTTISYDPRYFPVANFKEYDFTGVIQTADNANKMVQSAYLDHISYHPAITVKNAAASEIAFMDFDSDLIPEWTYALTDTLVGAKPPGSHVGNSEGLSTGQTFHFTLQKNPQAVNYIFSVWVSSGSGTTFHFTLTPTGGGTPATYTKSVPNTAGKWQYVQYVLPVGSMTSTFTVKDSITCSSNIGVDDIILYPQNAVVSTYAYEPTTYFKIAETNTNGISAYYTSDQWGRLLFQYDQDKNIVQKMTYVTPDDIRNFTAPGISYTSADTITTVTPVTFNNSGAGNAACYGPSTTYVWNFGDGSAPVTTTSASSVTHTFSSTITAPTKYGVTLTASSPYFKNKVTSIDSVTVSPIYVSIAYTNLTTASSIDSVTFTKGGVSTHIAGTALNGAKILQGFYSIRMHPVGGAYNPGTGKGYTIIEVSDGATPTCYPRTGSDITFSWDLSNRKNFSFTMINTACP